MFLARNKRILRRRNRAQPATKLQKSVTVISPMFLKFYGNSQRLHFFLITLVISQETNELALTPRPAK